MDEQRRLLLALVLVALVVVGMGYLWPLVFGQDPSQGGRGEPDRASNVDGPAGLDDNEPDPGEPDPDDPATEPDEPEPATAAKAPSGRQHRPEKRVTFASKEVSLEVTSHGGGLTKAELLAPEYREGWDEEERPLDLVSVDLSERPELQPLEFRLIRRRAMPPSSGDSAEGRGVLRLVNRDSISREQLEELADVPTATANRMLAGRDFRSLEDLEAAIGGSDERKRAVLANLLTAAWRLGFVRLDFEILHQDENRLVLRAQTDDQLEVVRTLTFSSDHELRVRDELRNRGKRAIQVRERLATTGLEKQTGGGGFFGRPTGLLRGLCLHGDEMVRRDRSHLAGESSGCMGFGCDGPAGSVSRSGSVRFAAVDRHFFMTALSPSPSWSETTCDLRASSDGVLQVSIEPVVFTQLPPGESTTYVSTAYLGPKQFNLLKTLGPGRHLWEAIDYGWFAVLAHFLLGVLRLFHGWFGNWGVAIILLTFLIKTLLLPVTHKTLKSMRQMQADMAKLKPELDQINERYKDQSDVKQQKTLELYQAHGINPLKQVSGCLPMFLQMPIWIALYRMISESVELYRAPFALWLRDLSAQDPYYVLPGLLGLSMFLQQMITPQPGVDNAQAKMMRWMMPGMFLFIMLNMPSGLVLYIFVNTLLTIVQQQFINRLVPAGPPPAAKSAKEPAGGQHDEGGSSDSGLRHRKSKPRRRKRK